ncbi:MAG: response regulator [Treponema sp.]|jgi:signal transduction histidine kinase|nr:response regulator [Treponema sp.]
MKSMNADFYKRPDKADIAAIIDALNKSLEIFTSHDETAFDEVMTRGIRLVADAVGLDRIVIYSLAGKENDKHLGQIYRWDKSEGGMVFLDEELEVLSKIPLIEKWILAMSKGGRVRIREGFYDEDETAFLQKNGIKSILILPIFTHGKLWGAVAFQDHSTSRYFDEGCEDLLYSAARLFANAIIRAKITLIYEKNCKMLEHHKGMMDMLNKVALKFLSQSNKSFEDTMTAGIREIADMFDLDRFSVWRNFTMPDGLHGGQIYRWDRQTGGTTAPLKGLEDISYAKTVPRWEKLFAEGGIINSPVRFLPEASIFQPFSTKSVFIVPVYFDNAFWGLVFFEDHHNERFFDEDSIKVIRSAALLCANIVLRSDLERTLANANEFTRAILDASPLNFTVIDETARIIDCNDATLSVFGTTKKYYLEHFDEFSPEYQSDGVKSKDKIKDVVGRAIGGEKQVFEWVHRTFSKELIPFEVTLTRTMHNGKHVVLGYQYDLRNIKKMEKSIAEAEELMSAVTEANPLSYVLFDDNLYPIDCNDVTMRLFACPDKQYLMEHYWDVFVPELQPDGDNSRDKAISKKNEIGVGRQVTFELVFRSFTGELIPVENTLTHIIHKGRKLIIAFKYDMRNIKKMSENLREQSEQLKDALYKATMASKAKSEFLSNMSHEMRTPLNAIIGMTDIGKNASDLERKNYALNRIQEASAHLLGIINDVLDISKIEANKVELSFIEFDFGKMLRQVINVVSLSAGEKQQELKINISRDIPKVLIGDNQRLAQVIANLLGNAVKFTPKNGLIELNTYLEKEENGLCTIRFSVSDTGIGINSEHQEKLFQPFQQAESSTTRKYGGTGLGLAICKNIVEMMGGTIWVRSEQGKGSTFTFTIKVKRSGPQTQEPSRYSVNRDDVYAEDHDDDHRKSIDGIFAGRRILLADDVEINREIVQALLEPTQVEIDSAGNGLEALRMFSEAPEKYDIILMDVQMPEMDGYEATRHIRLLDVPKASTIPIVAMTANVFRDDIENCLEAGMNDHLGKPLDFDIVVEKLRRYLP